MQVAIFGNLDLSKRVWLALKDVDWVELVPIFAKEEYVDFIAAEVSPQPWGLQNLLVVDRCWGAKLVGLPLLVELVDHYRFCAFLLRL